MNRLGEKIAKKRKDLGMTQMEFAEKMSVTRQTVSRWEAGAVLPDIEKLSDIAALLGVSCDYLLKDEMNEAGTAASTPAGPGRLLQEMTGRQVRLTFFDEEADPDLYNAVCTIREFSGNWMKLTAATKKGDIEKLIPVSSVRSMEIVKEES